MKMLVLKKKKKPMKPVSLDIHPERFFGTVNQTSRYMVSSHPFHPNGSMPFHSFIDTGNQGTPITCSSALLFLCLPTLPCV